MRPTVRKISPFLSKEESMVDWKCLEEELYLKFRVIKKGGWMVRVLMTRLVIRRERGGEKVRLAERS